MSAQVATRKKVRKKPHAPAAGLASRVRPLYDRVLLRRIEKPEQIRGGLVIPDTAKEKPQEAEVIAVGPGRFDEKGRRRSMDVRAGDRVLIGKYVGTDIRVGEEDLVILHEDDLLAVIEQGAHKAKRKTS